jgi:hypothetical protein|tara:strand:- start:3258 stop:4616 length:1359 start_codon:yes stop_codon:yes gene_type:complete
MYMLFGLLTLFTALAIAGVAAWFSIVGLMTFFQGAAMSIAVMAGTLEVGKLVTVSWLYRYWNETSLLVKIYLSTAVLFLMLITSIGIFGYLSKAHQEVSGNSADAFAIVDRLDGQILREENKIELLEERIASLQTGGGLDVSASIQQQETIRDGAWERVQGDIDFANGQIERLRDQLATLDKAVNDLRSKGVEVIETDAGGTFRRAETETIDYVAQANELFAQQSQQRADIKADIDKQQANIDKYREQAQADISSANAEINKLRENSSANQDDTLVKIDEFNEDIDDIYENIVLIKDEKFEAQQIVRDIEKEVGPIKYVAELIYGESGKEVLDDAIRLFIILLVVVFDPLAVMLLIAANQTLLRYGINLEATGPKPHFVNEILDDDDFETQSRKIYGDNMPDVPEVKEVIKEVIVEKEVQKEIDMNTIKTPRAVKALEKKLKKKLDDDGTRS